MTPVPKPLQPIALGLFIVWFSVSVNGFDLLANPIGWLIVIGAATAIPASAATPRLRWALGLALTVSLPLAVPVWAEAVDDADPSLGWAVSLPQAVAIVLLVQVLLELARRAGDQRATSALAFTRTALVVLAVLPVVVLGAGFEGWAGAAGVITGLSVFAVLVQLVYYADRPWARPTGDMGESPTNSDWSS